MKRICSALLAAGLLVSLMAPSALAADSDVKVSYDLTANGAHQVTVDSGATVTVTLTVNRADGKAEAYNVNAWEDEIVCDKSFFTLVDSSVTNLTGGAAEAKAMVRTPSIPIVRASQLGGSCAASYEVVSFQLKVTATSGSGWVRSDKRLSYDSDGNAIGITANDLQVTIASSSGGGGGGSTTKPEQKPCHTFKDVKTSDWFHSAVDYVADKGWFKGSSEEKFEPNGQMTRAMFVTVIARMDNVDESKYPTCGFDDVTNGTWYAPSVAWAAEKGIVLGVGQNRFAPEDPITREQMAVMLSRYTDYAKKTVNGNGSPLTAFADKDDVSDWAEAGMAWATESGIVTGTGGGRLDPLRVAIRSEMAQLVKNYAEAAK